MRQLKGVHAFQTTKYRTKNYDLFIEKEENRNAELMKGHQKRIGESMKRHGFLESKPILVTEKNGKLEIEDGQNRFREAKKLGIEVVFELLTDISTALMRDLQISKDWAIKDVIHNYVVTGESQSVVYVNSLVAVYPKAQPGTVASMLIGERTNGTKMGLEGIRTGNIKMTYKDETEKTLLFIDKLYNSPLPDRIKREVWKRPFMKTIYNFMRNSNFNSDRMLEKMLAHHAQLLVWNTIPEYYNHLEEIYNKHTHVKNQVRFEVRPGKK